MRYPATLRAGIVLNSQEFAARALTFVIIDVSLQVLTVISELAIFRKRNAESRIYIKKSPLHFIIFAWICQ